MSLHTPAGLPVILVPLIFVGFNYYNDNYTLLAVNLHIYYSNYVKMICYDIIIK